MDKVEIKEITIEDIPDYVKVNIKAWQESYKGLIGDEILIDVENNVENSIKRQINKFLLIFFINISPSLIIFLGFIPRC